MAEYIITTDDAQDAGVTAARNSFNASIVLAQDEVLEQHPDFKADNQAYLQYVMSIATDSYRQLTTITLVIDDPVVVEQIIEKRIAAEADAGRLVTDNELIAATLSASVKVG